MFLLLFPGMAEKWIHCSSQRRLYAETKLKNLKWELNVETSLSAV